MMLRKGLPPGKVIQVAASQASVEVVHLEADPEARPSSIQEAGAEVAGPRSVEQARKDKELMRSGERSA
jgi:hypothetical protein